MVRTLVVDDERGVRFFLSETLERIGHEVVAARNGEEALALLRENEFDLVILDLRLGGRVDGMRVLESLKWLWPDTAAVILTAHGSLESAMAAIREGVDGYLLKPVRARDLRQTVREVLERRSRTPTREKARGNLLQAGPLSVDPEKHLATLDGRPLELTASEFKLLVHLMRNAHRVVPASELVKVVQGYDCQDEREAREIIRWYIHRLRRKVEPEPSTPQYIVNVRGVGYTFESLER